MATRNIYTNKIHAEGVKFPATAVASADANTLDDYEEGTWTPVLTFDTPGDLAITYSTQLGWYTKIGNLVTVNWSMVTSAFTHTTASGNSKITSLPFTSSSDTGYSSYGSLGWQGITKASYTHVYPSLANNSTQFQLLASGSGQTISGVSSANMPSGGSVILRGTLSYRV